MEFDIIALYNELTRLTA